MKPFRSALLLLASIGAWAAPASGQLPLPFSLSVEVNPGVAIPLGDFAGRESGVEASPGVSIGGGATLGFGSFGVYGDYRYARFGCGECETGGLDDQVVDAGWEAGVQLRLPLPLLPVTPWVRGGVVGHQLQFSGDGATVTSEQALGYGVGVGAYLSLPGPLQLAPSVRYRSYRADFEFDDPPARSTDVSAAVASLGLVYRF